MYWQIIIQDASNLSGTAVAEFMADVLRIVPFNTIQIYEFEGSANRDLWAGVVKNRIIEVRTFFEIIHHVTQVDWATFCCLKDLNVLLCSQNYLEECFYGVQYGEAVIRCVDGQFFYLYTRNNELSDAIQKKYVCLSVTKVNLENIEWPQ